MRDWEASLWPASYMGVPFWIEKDDEDGGKRLHRVEFPNRDTPYIQDLGAKAVDFTVKAYLIGDTSDVDSTALVQMFLAQGPGPLSLPIQGIVNARLHNYKRQRERDKMGLVSFDLVFMQDGAATAVTSTGYLGQLVFDAGSALASAAGSLLQTGLSLL